MTWQQVGGRWNSTAPCGRRMHVSVHDGGAIGAAAPPHPGRGRRYSPPALVATFPA